jgi:peptidoglycan hydrolase-like protein with peptidoglycan-binding domain
MGGIRERAACDPDRSFLFSHPFTGEALALRDCVERPDGPVRVPAPTLSNALVSLVQRHLVDLGFDPGPVDGLMGPRTRKAIRRFQRAQGSAEDGKVTFDLLGRIHTAAATRGARGADSDTASE